MKHWVLLAAMTLVQVVPARAAENIICAIQTVDANSGVIFGFSLDSEAAGAILDVGICFDSPTPGEHCVTVPSNAPDDGNGGICPLGSLGGGCFVYRMSGAVGSVDPLDGNPHVVHVRAISRTNPGGADVTALTSPLRVQYDPASGKWKGRNRAVLEAFPARLTASQIAVLVNTADPYSIGTLRDVCVGGTPAIPLGSDGAAGYYVQKRGIPCANVHEFALPVGPSTAYIPLASFNATISPVLEALPASIQAIAAAFVQPSGVSGATGQAHNGMTSMLATNHFFVPTNTYRLGGSVAGGDIFSGPQPNPYFNTASTAPFTDYGIRPAMMIAAQTCTTCNPSPCDWVPSVTAAKALIDLGASATDTNPSNCVVKIMLTGDSARNVRSRNFSPLDAGTALSPCSASVVLSNSNGTDYLNNQPNILYYGQARATQLNSGGIYSWGTGDTYVPGGIADSVTSAQGVFPNGGSQTPATEFIRHGAVASYGCVSEPIGLLKKFPDPAILLPNYAQGQSIVEAYWKSVEFPFQCNFIGDPLASPFPLQEAACGSGIPMRKARLELRARPSFVSLKGAAVFPKPWRAVAPASNGLAFTIRDSAGTPSLDVVAPPGDHWRTNDRGTTWTYNGPGGRAGSVMRIKVTDRSAVEDGLIRWSVHSSGGTATLPEVDSLRTVIWFGDARECAAMAWNPPTGDSPRCKGDATRISCR